MKNFSDRLLRWFCRRDYYTDISGDLEELYHLNLQQYSPTRASWLYLADVLLLLRLSLLKKLVTLQLFYSGMLTNYLKISIRNLLHHKFFTFINISGLAVGLAAFMLLSSYIRLEKSYDQFFSEPQSLYRLTTDQIKDGVIGIRDAMSFNPSGGVLTEELPEVLEYTCTYKFGEIVFRRGQQVHFEKGIVAADSNYFRLFDYDILAGNPATALSNPYSLVLTESKARELFGNTDVVGRSIEVLSGFDRSFEVTAVMQDVPENTHYHFDILMSLHTLSEILEREAWSNFNYYTYLRVDPKADIAQVRSKLPELSRKYIGEESSLNFHLQPVTSIHLHSDFTYEPEIHGSAEAVKFLTIIAAFVLLMAWINYINLSTARAVDRAKEVGLRKVVGAVKRNLIFQFLIEAMLVNLVGTLLAVVLAELALPIFNNMMEKVIAEHIWMESSFLLQALAFFLIGTLATGFYPALVLSQFRPVAVLKGKFRHSKSGSALRKGLVIAQFAISLALVAGTMIVTRQVQYMRSLDKGYNTDQVVGFRNPSVSDDQREARNAKLLSFYDALRTNENIVNAASLTNLPGGGSSDISSNAGGIRLAGKTDIMETTVYIQVYDDNVLETLGLELVAGRNFNKDLAIDTASVIINEAMMNVFGLDNFNDVLNERVQFGRDPENDRYPIVGVVRNANRTTLKRNVEPTLFFFNRTLGNSMVKLKEAHIAEGLEVVEAEWEKFFPNTPLEITFLDERFDRLYKEDQRFGKAFGAFSVLALVVALLGLLGLSYFLSVQRTKEVGVRKVLGASVTQIITLFFKDFLVLIGLASILSLPSTYFAMNSWLQGYAFRVGFPWELLVIALVAITAFALVTVGLQTRRVATMDPAATLKYE